MKTIEELRERLSRYCLARVSRQTGLHYNVVYRVARGTVKNPSYDTVLRLSNYLDGELG